MSIYEYLNPQYKELPQPIAIEEWRKDNPSAPEWFSMLLPNEIVRVEKIIPAYEVFETDTMFIGRNRAVVTDGIQAWETDARNIYKGFDTLVSRIGLNQQLANTAQRFSMINGTQTCFAVRGNRVMAAFEKDGVFMGGLNGTTPQPLEVDKVFNTIGEALAYIKSII